MTQRLHTPDITLLPLATQEIVDALLRDGLHSEAAELTTTAREYVERHSYYAVFSGLGHLSLIEDK